MSAGKFQDRIYVTNSDAVYSIRVQPETITPWNENGTGSILPGSPSVAVSKGRRTIGINARVARFRWVGTSAPAGYDPSGIITVPILTRAAFQALTKGISYPYLTGGLELVGKSEEAIR